MKDFFTGAWKFAEFCLVYFSIFAIGVAVVKMAQVVGFLV